MEIFLNAGKKLEERRAVDILFIKEVFYGDNGKTICQHIG
jgi:hypothetical protein